MDHLELLHRKVRELGAESVRSLLPAIHTNKFGSIMTGAAPIPDHFIAKMKEVWPDEMPKPIEAGDDSVMTFSREINQLHFAILSPVRNSYDPRCVSSVVGIVRRTGCGWIQRPFDSMIARSRNILAAAFLKTDYEWSLWIDDDMIIPNGDANWFKKSVKRPDIHDQFAGVIAPFQLASWGEDKLLVSAVYYSRQGDDRITAGFNSGTSMINKVPSKSLMPARYAGLGCCMVHRKVYEDILQRHPDLWKTNSNECQVFSTMEGDGRMLGEDEAFGVRAAEAGHPTHLDLSVVCGHVALNVLTQPYTSIR